MKILQLNCADTRGGASRIAYSLSKGLIARGHEVTYLVGEKTSDEPFIEKLEDGRPDGIRKKILHRLGTNFLNLDSRSLSALGREYFERFDLIQLHDSPHLNQAAIPWLSKIRPLALTLHNMAFFTGNCLYSNGCERWKERCGKCPEFGNFPLKWLHRDASKLNLRLRKWFYHRARKLHVVGVSAWIAKLASQSVLKNHQVHTIPNHSDSQAFTPIPKAEAKARLGIDPEKPAIIFSVASNPEDIRKGTAVILEALRRLGRADITLIPLGITPENPSFTKLLSDLPFPSLTPRHLSTDAELNLHYSAADLLWHPSLADTSSLTILEAFASGTPAIASDVGGVGEFFKGRPTGILIPPNDPDALARATEQLLADPKNLGQLSRDARTTVEENFSYGRFLDRYESLYHKMTS